MADDILAKINAAKSDFYDQNKKNVLFKNKQKFECAENAMKGLNHTDVYSQVFAVNNNVLRFNYPLFKTIAHPEIYSEMADYIHEQVQQILNHYPHFVVDFICNGITVSAVDRYKDFVSVMSKRGLAKGNNLLVKCMQYRVFNPPSFVDYALKIFIPLMNFDISSKVVLYQTLE